MTDGERRLWRGLRDRRIAYKFRRQEPLGPYVLDFVCFEKRLVVELDGGQHLDSRKDTIRDEWLRKQGFKVLRFWNGDVLTNTRGVVALIQAELESPSPHPPPQGGRVARLAGIDLGA